MCWDAQRGLELKGMLQASKWFGWLQKFLEQANMAGANNLQGRDHWHDKGEEDIDLGKVAKEIPQ